MKTAEQIKSELAKLNAKKAELKPLDKKDERKRRQLNKRILYLGRQLEKKENNKLRF